MAESVDADYRSVNTLIRPSNRGQDDDTSTDWINEASTTLGQKDPTYPRLTVPGY